MRISDWSSDVCSSDLKAFVSGGAPLNYDIGVFFQALGLRILQGYGQTESAPVVSCNPPGRNKLRTVGRPLAGVQVRIAEDGEILEIGRASGRERVCQYV